MISFIDALCRAGYMVKIIKTIFLCTFWASFLLGCTFDYLGRKKKKRAEEIFLEYRNIHVPCGIYEGWVKRPLDCFLASFAVIILSPVLLWTALAVKIKLGSPVIFTQERPGKDLVIFKMKKFRTMTEERDDKGNLLPDEIRLTVFGRLLRSTSLDELPELINVAMGDMAIIGPRPLLIRYLPFYTADEMHRHDVRPGLTGLAQISGRNYLPWNERFSLDLRYVNHITFANDICIAAKTIKKVLFRQDIVAGSDQVLQDLDEERGI